MLGVFDFLRHPRREPDDGVPVGQLVVASRVDGTAFLLRDALHDLPRQPASVHASTRPHALLVMGTHGWSGIDRLLLGSVAERVAHTTHCPLPVVPPHASPMPSGATLKQILCAVDFHPGLAAGAGARMAG